MSITLAESKIELWKAAPFIFSGQENLPITIQIAPVRCGQPNCLLDTLAKILSQEPVVCEFIAYSQTQTLTITFKPIEKTEL